MEKTLVVDHIDPIIPLDKLGWKFSWEEDFNLDLYIDCDTLVIRTLVEEEELQALCQDCHNTKSHEEHKVRWDFKEKIKNGYRG